MALNKATKRAGRVGLDKIWKKRRGGGGVLQYRGRRLGTLCQLWIWFEVLYHLLSFINWPATIVCHMVTLDRPPTWSTSPLTWLRIEPIPMTITTLFFARFYSSRKFCIHLYSEEQISLLIKILSFCGASSTIIFHQQIHGHVTFFGMYFPP